MDSTGRLWRTQQLKGKLAAGFTVSSLPSGDKQSTLLSMFVFSMQHGMLWVGNPILPEQHSGVPYDEAANRLGSWSGLMAQAGHSAAARVFRSWRRQDRTHVRPALRPKPEPRDGASLNNHLAGDLECFPSNFAPALFGLILSGLMSLLVSGISTYRAVGFGDGLAGLWVSAWLTAWLVAFPVVLVVAPLARRTVALLVDDRP